MDDALTSDQASTLQCTTTPLGADGMEFLLRRCKHAPDDLSGKVRTLKSEVGRLSCR